MSASVNHIFQTHLKSLGSARGELSMPCVPALLDCYLEQILALMDVLGVKFKEDRIVELRQRLADSLEEGYRASQHSRLIVRYEPAKPPQSGLFLEILAAIESLKDFYEKVVREHFGHVLEEMETSIFGKLANAKVLDVAAQLGDASAAIVDVGAGSGRNTLPLARLGHPVLAIELAEVFTTKLQEMAAREALPVRVMLGDILHPLVRLPWQQFQLAILAEILPHFRHPDQVRLTLVKMCDAVVPGGFVLFNTFLAREGYEPTIAERQIAEVSQAFLMTRSELLAAMADLPLAIATQEAVFDYERDRLPPDAFPPSPWFDRWTKGELIFQHGESPMSLQWICCRRL